MATINKIKVGNNTYDLSASGNYLPLSGGTMTGPIVQGFNNSIIVDSNDAGQFDMNNGFELYSTTGSCLLVQMDQTMQHYIFTVRMKMKQLQIQVHLK